MSSSSQNENLPPKVIMSLMKEIRSLCNTPPDGIQVYFSEDDLTNIFADVTGPEGTPYEGGVFKCKLVLGADYPNSPPKGYFLTTIYHPNVSKAGDICVNALKKDWKPSLGIKHLLMIIKCLLIVPNPASALNEDAGKMLLDNYEDFSKRAALMTKIHAKPKGKAADTETEATTEETVVTAAADTKGNKENAPLADKEKGANKLVEAGEGSIVVDKSAAVDVNPQKKVKSISDEEKTKKDKAAMKKKALKRL